jgi:hypothetical protein
MLRCRDATVGSDILIESTHRPEGVTMKYMLLIYGNHAAWDAMTEQSQQELIQVHVSLQAELTASGELLDVNELPLQDAKIVRTSGGVPVVTDGPFAESKEILAGYYLVDCASVERAAEIAGRLVEAEFAPIEVRQVSGG